MIRNLFNRLLQSRPSSGRENGDALAKKRGEQLLLGQGQSKGKTIIAEGAPNPLRQFFDSRQSGRGIWKWTHYFDAYHRHLSKFINQAPSMLEVGIYSGGSLEMWKSYFGPHSHIYGCDIEPECSKYSSNDVTIFIGDQADRTFWRNVTPGIPRLDVVVDDGGHTPEQQMVTLEELLPRLSPGGVFICEDIHGHDNPLWEFVTALIRRLQSMQIIKDDPDDPKERLVVQTTAFQSAIHSIHCYPYMLVIEKANDITPTYIAPKQGTSWQPFLG
jgi:hypothetical protein